MGWFIATWLGLSMGSFLTMLVPRLRQSQALWGKGANRSRCPSCSHILGVRDLVPVFSYIVARGQCRYCGQKIGVKYILIEIAVTAIFVICYAFFFS